MKTKDIVIGKDYGIEQYGGGSYYKVTVLDIRKKVQGGTTKTIRIRKCNNQEYWTTPREIQLHWNVAKVLNDKAINRRKAERVKQEKAAEIIPQLLDALSNHSIDLKDYDCNRSQYGEIQVRMTQSQAQLLIEVLNSVTYS